MVRHASGHAGRHAERLVQPHEVVMREVKRHGGAKVLHLLGERIRQPREPPHAHAHGEVLPLHVAGRDVRGIGTAHDGRHLHARHMGRAVPSGSDWFGLVKFDDLGVVHVCPERLVGRVHVGRKGVRGKLYCTGRG